VRRGLLAWLAAWLIRAWTATLRYRLEGAPIDGPGLLAFRHGDQLPLFGLRRGRRLVAPVSLSRDGRLQARILAHLGIATVAGSSSRGGARAARGLLRALRSDRSALLAVDGPRGPFGQVKPGVVFLARRTGLPIWPVGVAVGAGRRLRRAWDRYLVPRPFTRALVLVGEPVRIPPDGDVEAGRAELEARLALLAEEAARRLRP
jgi:lysophospholipid acyltransferase (LPLAT)-like uncharacterized protein